MMIKKSSLLWLTLLLAVGVSCAGIPTPVQEVTDGQPANTLIGHECPQPGGMAGDVIVNGGFEEGRIGWALTSTGTGATWREHELIGVEPAFEPHTGSWAARLGGYEGSFDRLEQLITIPPGGLLSYWWQIRQPRPVSWLMVSLVRPGESEGVVLAVYRDGEAEEGWQQDCIDLSQFEGQEYILQINVANDNYTMTAFDIDDVELGCEGEP
jgi:hypothetical protein